MLTPFFATAMRAPGRQLSFRRTVALHVGLLSCLGWVAANAEAPAVLPAVGQVTLVLGIVEGASLAGWRLTQLPKSQALEFLLVSPLRPRMVFLAETLVGVARLALVGLSGLPVLLAMVLAGAIGPDDLWPLLLMPFAWGVVAALGLTAWSYESAGVRRVGEFVGLFGVLVYLVVGILAGENIRLWLAQLPPAAAEWVYAGVMQFHHGNPFGVVRNWFISRGGPGGAWPQFVGVNVLAAGLALAFGLRAAFRLQGHFHDRHYTEGKRSTEKGKGGDPGSVFSFSLFPFSFREQPLAVWSVRRVMEFSGRVNVWLAGGFCLLYAAFIIAGDRWPPWLGKVVFLIFESLGGAPMVATAMCVLAAVPAVFQYGLWDSTVSDRCKRLELLLLTDLSGRDYWHASLAASWRRGRSYLVIAALLWAALAVSGRAAWYDVLAAALGGLVLWAFSFAVGFRAFCTGNQAGGVASLLTLGMPFLLAVLLRAKLETLAAFVPTAACYLPLKTGVTWYWATGLALVAGLAWWLTREGLRHCDADLRRWYDANQGRKAE